MDIQLFFYLKYLIIFFFFNKRIKATKKVITRNFSENPELIFVKFTNINHSMKIIRNTPIIFPKALKK